ncbi:MAG TPA: PQQ-binding-like beta-propeller repeat protein [Acidimicrobiales bacterium]|nr:PQQ-binding-like beta-propeller repeat protein [Acidimicrobiales bacterium]
MGTGTRLLLGAAMAAASAMPIAGPTASATPRAAPAAVRVASAGTCGPTAGAGQAPWPEFGGGPLHLGDGVEVPHGAAGSLHQAWASVSLDGAVYGEPVVAGGCLYVATEDDSVYALDAATGALRWHVHLATAVTSGLPCGDIDPSGITGAPVLDAAKGELFVAVLTYFSARPGHELVGLRASNGRVLSRQPFALPGTNPAAQQQRAALQLERGNVYVSLGGLYGDCNRYLGAVISIPEKPGTPSYWHVPTANQAGIWEPGGPDLLPDGDLLLADGNGAGSAGQPFDGSNAVFELTPALSVAGVFAPSDWAALNASDTDLGSTGPAVLPGGLALQVGKSGTGYLVRIDRLGGVGGQLAAGQVCSGGAYGADAVSGRVVYVPCENGLTAVAVSARSFRVLWTSSAGGTGCPVVAGGRVFEQTSGGQLQAIDQATGRALQAIGLLEPVTHFPWLVAVGGELYAASGTKLVAYSGL